MTKRTSLMTATALVGLLAAAPAFAQSDPAQDPASPAAPPATMESQPDAGMGSDSGTGAAPSMTPSPGTEMPDATSPNTGTSDTQAQTPEMTQPGAEPTEEAAAPTEMFLEQQAEDEVLASSLIGAEVKNSSDESLGDISDLVLAKDGSVEAVIIGVGGFLGIGQKNVAVSFSQVEPSTDADGNVQLTLNVTREELESAPAYVTIEEDQQDSEAQSPAMSDPMAPAAPGGAPAEPAAPASP